MADQHQGCSGVGVSIAFLSGAVIGAVAAILYTPKSGAETRTALRGYARRTEDEVLEKAKEIRADLSHTVEEAKRYLKEAEATIAAALAAGKEAFKKEKTDRA
ncbi:MAG: YtxH domain-containing protein [Nitrospira sp.]|nr:YtxH domain-containing protein [Nitrospira sp.]